MDDRRVNHDDFNFLGQRSGFGYKAQLIAVGKWKLPSSLVCLSWEIEHFFFHLGGWINLKFEVIFLFSISIYEIISKFLNAKKFRHS